MRDFTPVRSALISVYDKTGLEPLVAELNKQQVSIYSTGGTLSFIQAMGVPVIPVESITNFPEILGGRVKTLHPGVFGGILYQRGLDRDEQSIQSHNINPIDLVIVDLYPFEETLKNTSAHQEIIEKIDIGGVSLLRAAAKNYHDVIVVSSKSQYENLARQLKTQAGQTTLEQRQRYAQAAFERTSAYDQAIAGYFRNLNDVPEGISLRYGENPHQKATFKGNISAVFDKLAGKELSYNNLLDVDAAVRSLRF